MINLKPTIVQALENNPTLINLLGGKRIYQLVAPDPNEFPRITYFEITNFDFSYSDDQSDSSEIHIQIDVWSKGSTSAISLEVDKTMKSIEFNRYSTSDLYEPDVKVYHKGLRYKITVFNEEATE